MACSTAQIQAGPIHPRALSTPSAPSALHASTRVAISRSRKVKISPAGSSACAPLLEATGLY
jgi:hypothetical protein